MNKSNHRSPFAIVGRLIELVKPMQPMPIADTSIFRSILVFIIYSSCRQYRLSTLLFYQHAP